MMTRYKPQIITLLAVLLLALCLTAFMPSGYGVAHADDAVVAVNFDNTDVMDDLGGSVFEGVPFSAEDYPYDPNGSISVLGFIEYGFSEYENLRDKYGLYLYIYNPALKEISTTSSKIQLATKFDVNGVPIAYDKFGLSLCSVSEGLTENRFWKFKVVGAEEIFETVDPAARTYYVSGVEIYCYGDKTVDEIPVNTSYTYTGFAEGFGAPGAEDIRCSAEKFETVDLQVQHTSFITGMSSLGNGHYNQIHTAYFAVPNHFFDNYGNLQKIYASWFEYKLKDILVTSNQALYNEASKYTGVQLSADQDLTASPMRLWYGYEHLSTETSSGRAYEWAFNIANREEHGWTGTKPYYSYTHVAKNSHMIPLVFYSPVEDPYEIFEFLNKYKTAGSVNSSTLLDGIYDYSNELGHGYVDPEEKEISADLFFDYVDDGRIRGYQAREVDFGDTFDLESYESNHNWFESLIDFGVFGKPEDIDQDLTIQPIYDVKDTDLLGNDDEIAKRLYINESDVDTFKEYYNARRNDNHIILFRFANTDYFARAVGYSVNGTTAQEENTDAYVCSETIFLDFDIISLTFNDDGEYRTFAVVSDPIDVVGGLDPPADSQFAEGLEEAGKAVKDFFNKIGEWFAENWKWVAIGAAVIFGIILVAIIIRLVRGNKVKIHVDPTPKSTKRKG